MKNPYIKKLIDISIYDLREVGVKNASLGELIREIDPEELAIPRGYAITATAHQSFMEQGGVKEKITTLLKQFNLLDAQQRNTIGISIRESIMKTPLPRNLKKQIKAVFRQLMEQGNNQTSIIARPSVITKNIFKRNYTSQQTFLNIKSEDELIASIKFCYANLYSDFAILNRLIEEQSQTDVRLALLIQKTVESDVGESGIAYSKAQKYGFENVIVVNGNYGMGGLIKRELVDPDEFVLHKPTLKKGLKSIISKTKGSKSKAAMLNKKLNNIPIIKSTPTFMQERFCISDKKALEIAQFVYRVEQYYSFKYGRDCRAEIEWALDGPKQKLFLVDVKPQCISSEKSKNVLHRLTSTNFNSSNKYAA